MACLTPAPASEISECGIFVPLFLPAGIDECFTATLLKAEIMRREPRTSATSPVLPSMKACQTPAAQAHEISVFLPLLIKPYPSRLPCYDRRPKFGNYLDNLLHQVTCKISLPLPSPHRPHFKSKRPRMENNIPLSLPLDNQALSIILLLSPLLCPRPQLQCVTFRW